jgi:hypothetical protein
MKRFLTTGFAALIGAIALPVAHAIEAEEWPWKTKAPPDPALALLRSVENLSVKVSEEEPHIVTIAVEATAPRPDFSELQLVYRLGERDDRTFEFDARGRPPLRHTEEETPSPVTIEAAYKDAPAPLIRWIEVHARDNCLRFSLADGSTTECQPMPAQAIEPLGTE